MLSFSFNVHAVGSIQACCHFGSCLFPGVTPLSWTATTWQPTRWVRIALKHSYSAVAEWPSDSLLQGVRDERLFVWFWQRLFFFLFRMAMTRMTSCERGWGVMCHPRDRRLHLLTDVAGCSPCSLRQCSTDIVHRWIQTLPRYSIYTAALVRIATWDACVRACCLTPYQTFLSLPPGHCHDSDTVKKFR